MIEIKVGTVLKVANKEDSVKIVQVDDKCKTAIVELPDGATKAYSFTTLKDKRRFTGIGEDDQYIADITEPEEEVEVNPEEPELVPMPGAEKLEELKNEVSGRKPRITITFNGETKTPSEFAEQFNMDPKYIRSQLRKGKTPEDIFGGK